MHEDVRINISSNTWNGYTAENQEDRLFFNEAAFLFWCHALWKLESSKRPKKIFWRPASPRLSQGLDDRPPTPPYLKVWMTALPPTPPYLKVWMTAPPAPQLPLISRSGWPHPPPLPPYLKVWIRHCITRVVFKLGSKVNCVCYGLATPHGDWLLYLTKHGPLFQQKRSKTKTNRDLHAHAWALCSSLWKHGTCNCFQFWLVHVAFFSCCDWS